MKTNIQEGRGEVRFPGAVAGAIGQEGPGGGQDDGARHNGDAAFLVTSGLIALSSATRNPQLFAQVNLTRTLIGRGRETDVVNRCRSLFDLGTAHAVLLAAKYHTNAADLKALDDAITAFGALKAQAARESGVQRGGDPGIGGFVRGPGRGAGEPA